MMKSLMVASRILDLLSMILVPIGLALAFLWVPNEKTMGEVQRIFYFHVPFAMSSFLGFTIVLFASLGYLRTRGGEWDVVAEAAAEVGFICCTIVLLTGPVWARAAWGVWWTWDARLTTTLVLWMIYAAYLVLRAYGAEEAKLKRYAAVLGIVGALDVPIVYFSVRWFRTQHPSSTFFTKAGLPVPSMAITLRFCLITVLILFLALLIKRIQIGLLEAERNQLAYDLEARD